MGRKEPEGKEGAFQIREVCAIGQRGKGVRSVLGRVRAFVGRGGECNLREAVAIWGFPGDSEGKASACSVGDLGSIPGSGRSPGEGNGNALWYSCLENPMEGEAW